MLKKTMKYQGKKVRVPKEQGLNDYAEIFSRKLTAVVQSQGWSQEEFGKRLGTTQAMAGRYMHGKANPTFDSLARIELATQVPAYKFFENDNSVPTPMVTSLSDEVKVAVQNANAENLALLKTIATNLEPAIKALQQGDESLPVNVQKVSRGRLRDFTDQFTDDSMTGYIYEMMGNKEPLEKIRIEFVRELAVNLLAEGGETAKEFRAVITELLDKESEMNRE
nr:hypothetical protein HAGR004_24890 [Bdellovibrio sp. HAGR004]